MVKASKSEKTSAPSEESRLRQGSGGQGLEETFSDIAALAEGCRFSDCRHESEPGCAVRQAIEEGSPGARATRERPRARERGPLSRATTGCGREERSEQEARRSVQVAQAGEAQTGVFSASSRAHSSFPPTPSGLRRGPDEALAKSDARGASLLARCSACCRPIRAICRCGRGARPFG